MHEARGGEGERDLEGDAFVCRGVLVDVLHLEGRQHCQSLTLEEGRVRVIRVRGGSRESEGRVRRGGTALETRMPSSLRTRSTGCWLR